MGLVNKEPYITPDMISKWNDKPAPTWGRFIFISDSYDSYGHWITACATALGLSSNDYVNIAQDGTAFYDGSWLQLLTTYTNGASAADIENTTHIVIGGGISDCKYSSQSTSEAQAYFQTLYLAIKAFNDYVEAHYPNAKIYYGFVGMALEKSPVLYNRGYDERIYCLSYMRSAMGDLPRFVVLKNTEYVLHKQSYLGSDGLHPNATGGVVIGRAIKDAILNGSAYVAYSYRKATITSTIGTMSDAYLWEYLENDKVMIGAGNLVLQNMTTALGGSTVTLGSIASEYFQRFNMVFVKCIIQTSNGTRVNTIGELTCENNTLYLSIHDIQSGSWSWTTYNNPAVLQIYIPKIIVATMET